MDERAASCTDPFPPNSSVGLPLMSSRTQGISTLAMLQSVSPTVQITISDRSQNDGLDYDETGAHRVVGVIDL